MKPAFIACIILVCCVLLSCEKHATVFATPAAAADIRPAKDKAQKTEADYAQDSLALIKILERAVARAAQHKEVSFTEKYRDDYAQKTFIADVTLRGGNWFNKNKKHVIVKREVSWVVYTDVFEVQNGKLMPKRHIETHGLTHINDSIMDINGDGHNDFAVHWYPMSGCCARDIYDVYLYRPKTNDFSQEYQFINPAFSPKEKTIRGLEYGHYPGMYKYRWNGAVVDTLEYVYRDTINENKYYITRRQASERPPEKESGIIRIINKLPQEYERVGMD